MAEPKIFNHPRPRKPLLPPPSKKRKTEHKIEEIQFDFSAREDYLTGFHKRKVQRSRAAALQREKEAKEERIKMRKQLREERKQELEEHVQAVNALLKDVNLPTPSSPSSDTSWDGIPDEAPETIDHEEEYISEDEDKYTTVTVEAVEVSKEGLQRVRDEDEEEGEEVPKLVVVEKGEEGERGGKGKKWPKKEKKKKFRYESKAERKVTRGKQKAGNKARADARRGGD